MEIADLAEDTAFSEKGPERTCIVTRRVGAPEGMLRFVLDPQGLVVPDLKRKLPGRGVWVSLDRDILAEAVRKKAFSRGLKAATKIPEGLVDEKAALFSDLVSRHGALFFTHDPTHALARVTRGDGNRFQGRAVPLDETRGLIDN